MVNTRWRENPRVTASVNTAMTRRNISSLVRVEARLNYKQQIENHIVTECKYSNDKKKDLLISQGGGSSKL